MSNNVIGIHNSNIIVPYTATTKRTKELNLAAYLTSPDWTCTNLFGRFECDSLGVWRFTFTGKLIKNSGTRVGNIALTFAGVDFAFDQEVASGGLNSGVGDYQPLMGRANGSLSTIDIIPIGTIAYDRVMFSDSVILSAEPTAYTIPANMEGITAVDVIIPEANATTTGLINTAAQTIAGVKTFSNGISLGNETLSVYDEGTFTSNVSNVAVTISGTCKYVRIGNAVTLYLFSWATTATANNHSYDGLPANIRPASTQIFPIGVTSVGVQYNGWIVITNSAIMEFYPDCRLINLWNSSGEIGVYAPVTITYLLT